MIRRGWQSAMIALARKFVAGADASDAVRIAADLLARHGLRSSLST